MIGSYLIQRLLKPFPPIKGKNASVLESLSNTFSFGGGLKNGGISEKGMSLIKDIFRFDYMGSAEFEWGAVPEALQKIAKNREMCIVGQTSVGENKTPVYIICQKEELSEVIKRVQKFASEWNHETKEHVCLYEVVNKKGYEDCCGWLELDNGYFFFTDKDMFERTVKLFKIGE